MSLDEHDYTHFFSPNKFSTSWDYCKGKINVPESHNLYMEESGIFGAQEALWVSTLDFLSRLVPNSST